MASSYDVSPWALQLEEAGVEIKWLNGYKGKSTHELAPSRPVVPPHMAGSSFRAPGTTHGHLVTTSPAPYHLQSCPQYNQHQNQQDRPWQPHQSPPAVVAGASGPSQAAIEKPAKRGAGRPPGSKNKPKSDKPEAPKEKRKAGRPPGAKNKPKVTAASESSQNQQVVYPHIQTQRYPGFPSGDQPLSSGQAHQAYYYHLPSPQDQYVHTQQPLNVITSPPTGITYPSTIAQKGYVGQSETQYTSPTDNANQAYHAIDPRLLSSPDQHLSNLVTWSNRYSEEQLNRSFQPYPTPPTDTPEPPSEWEMAFKDSLQSGIGPLDRGAEMEWADD